MAMTMNAVLDHELLTRGAAIAVVGLAASRRYKYVRLGRWPIIHVIVDVDANGHEDWTEQAPEEVCWYPFTPSKAEREMLQRMADPPSVSNSWPCLAVPNA